MANGARSAAHRAYSKNLPLIALLAVAFSTLALPLALVAIPPLLDYPNHLVRLWLIAGGAEQPPLSRMYAVSWTGAYTNVGIDYVGALLGRLVPIIHLGNVLVFLALILPPLGAVAVNRVLFGGVHWWQIAFVFFAWNATLIAGFLNFQIGLGLALLGLALDLRMARSSATWRFCVRMAMASLILAVHLFGLLFYCALLAGIATGWRLTGLTSARGLSDRFTAVLVSAGAAVIPGIAFVVLAPSLPGAHVDAAGNAPLWDFSLYTKTHTLLSPIVTYAFRWDIGGAVAVAAPLGWALATGRLAVHAGLLVSAAALAVLGVLSPVAMSGTWWIDNRFPLMAVLALMAGVRPDVAWPAGRWIAAGLLACIVTARSIWITGIWQDRQADIQSVFRAVQPVGPGSAVLPLDNVASDMPLSAYPSGRFFHNGHPAHWSYSVLAITWRQAFVPNLFWAAGKQPIVVLPPWNEISLPEDGLLPSDLLIDIKQMPAHFRQWRTRYDYVLLINADVGSGADLSLVPELVLERDEGFARLYRIVGKPGGPEAARNAVTRLSWPQRT